MRHGLTREQEGTWGTAMRWGSCLLSAEMSSLVWACAKILSRLVTAKRESGGFPKLQRSCPFPSKFRKSVTCHSRNPEFIPGWSVIGEQFDKDVTIYLTTLVENCRQIWRNGFVEIRLRKIWKFLNYSSQSMCMYVNLILLFASLSTMTSTGQKDVNSYEPSWYQEWPACRLNLDGSESKSYKAVIIWNTFALTEAHYMTLHNVTGRIAAFASL